MPPARTSRTGAARLHPLKRARFWLICLFFFLWAGVICARLFWLQVVRHQEFVVRAEHMHLRTFEVAPRRGILSDRNGNGLAMTVLADSVFADPTAIDDKQTAAHALAAIVHVDPDDADSSEDRILGRLTSGRNFAWVARRVTPQAADAVRALNLKGVYFVKEFKRFYPANLIAAQVLGYVGMDDNGLGGIEQKFDSMLHGAPGLKSAAMDARHQVVGSTEREPQSGRNLTLTIDSNIQFIAERALEHAMEHTQAENGTVVVQDVHTGQILALAVRPTFNPNQFRHASPALLRNHAVSDVYEPGSTFKLVTYAAALDQHVVTPDDIIDCHGSVITVGGKALHDDKGDHFGRIPVHDALAHSSNVAAVQLAQRLGPQRFYQYVQSFGFGTRSGIELPGETRGLVAPANRATETTVSYMGMGQGIAVTPVQLSTMVSAIANGGLYLPPHILMPTQPTGQGSVPPSPVKPGEEIPSPLPQGAHRVMSTMTSAQMRKMMEGVVLFGTGRSAQLNGYSSAGKTGTAQKIDPATHAYSKSLHVASFAGFAPVNNPVIAVAVIIDSPKGSYYGASVSAPVFAEIAQQVLEYIGVPHDTQLHAVRKDKLAPVDEDEGGGANSGAAYSAAFNDLPSDDPLRSQAALPAPAPQTQSANNRPAAPAPPPPPQPTSKTVLLSDTKRLRVPSLNGLSVRKVIEQAGAAGFEVQISGSGICHQQSPEAGASVPAGTRIQVHCGR
jgi:cell division protein FtsI (penicillin-binding protein 3)